MNGLMKTKIFGKPLGEYFGKIKYYAAGVFIWTLVQISAGKLGPSFSFTEYPLVLVRVGIFLWAGWTVAHRYKFNMKQTAVCGCLVSVSSVLAQIVGLYAPLYTSSLVYGVELTIQLSVIARAVVVNLTNGLILVLAGGWLPKRPWELVRILEGYRQKTKPFLAVVFKKTKPFIVALFLLTLLEMASFSRPSTLITIFNLARVIIFLWTGWTLARGHKFSIRQSTLAVGLISLVPSLLYLIFFLIVLSGDASLPTLLSGLALCYRILTIQLPLGIVSGLLGSLLPIRDKPESFLQTIRSTAAVARLFLFAPLLLFLRALYDVQHSHLDGVLPSDVFDLSYQHTTTIFNIPTPHPLIIFANVLTPATAVGGLFILGGLGWAAYTAAKASGWRSKSLRFLGLGAVFVITYNLQLLILSMVLFQLYILFGQSGGPILHFLLAAMTLSCKLPKVVYMVSIPAFSLLFFGLGPGEKIADYLGIYGEQGLFLFLAFLSYFLYFIHYKRSEIDEEMDTK